MMKKEIHSMLSLKGKVAIVTGASRGIGKEIADTYSNAGAQVVICSRKRISIEEAAKNASKSGGQVLPVVANVSISSDRKRLVETAMNWAGQVDILVNNAGANPSFGALADLTEEAWDRVFEVNLKASFFLCQLVYNAWMKDHGGVIVNIASAGGLQAVTGINAYNVAKSGLMHLTRALASEWGRNGIRVNSIAPGLIKTRMSKAIWDSPFGESVVKHHPIARLGKVGDISGAALLLASEASSFITGQSIVVDGGQLLATPHNI